jgi:diadenosine tetraphosphate (Ap4A) HIT family hydrolase
MIAAGSPAKLLLAVLLVGSAAWGFDLECACDAARPESMQARQCSLCGEAEKQDAGSAVFFLKDINPRKPNRWLALPRRHLEKAHHLHELSPKERAALWKAAIGKATELWGDEWGLAYNGPKSRTQCHTHIHIGKFLKAAEQGKFIVVSSPDKIPVPENVGVWVHPVGRNFHVHTGEQITETVLLR